MVIGEEIFYPYLCDIENKCKIAKFLITYTSSNTHPFTNTSLVTCFITTFQMVPYIVCSSVMLDVHFHFLGDVQFYNLLFDVTSFFR